MSDTPLCAICGKPSYDYCHDRPSGDSAATDHAYVAPTTVELSDLELRAIADEARRFDAEPIWPTWQLSDYGQLSLKARAYAEGVIAERKRARAVRELAVKLARTLDECETSLSDAGNLIDDELGGDYQGTLAEISDDVSRARVALDEARAAGLLDGGP